MVAGGSSALPTSSLLDLVRLYLSLSGTVEQRGAVLGSFLSAAAVTSAGGVPAPAAPVPTAVPVACLSAVSAPGASTPAGAASVITSPGQCERAQGSFRPEKTPGSCLVRRGPVRVGSVAGVGLLPLLTLPVRPVYLPPLPLGLWIRS